MPKQVHDTALDAAYGVVDNATVMHVISAYAIDDTRATVIANSLADVTTAGGDFTIADGDAGAGSRKVTVAAKNSVPVDATGTATHIALIDATNVLMVTTCTSQALTSGNTVNVPSYKHEFGIPS